MLDSEQLNPVRWVGSSLKDLKSFPPEVKAEVRHALNAAQQGDTDPATTPLKGFGGVSVMEIVAPFDGNTWPAEYTVRFRGFVFVLHAFQKKSKLGSATTKKDIDLNYQRLAAAERDYKERQNDHEDQRKNR
jgi:phage-related protein